MRPFARSAGWTRSVSASPQFFAVGHGAHADGLLELARERGLVRITAGERDLGDGFVRSAEALAGGGDADLDEVLSGGDVEQRADALVELIDGQARHFGEARQAQCLVIVAVDV